VAEDVASDVDGDEHPLRSKARDAADVRKDRAPKTPVAVADDQSGRNSPKRNASSMFVGIIKQYRDADEMQNDGQRGQGGKGG